MKPFRFLRSQGPATWAGLLAGAVLIFPSAGPGHDTPTRTVKHGVPAKPPATPPASASVIPSDPVPNTEDATSGAPLNGGIRYAWTVNLAGNTSASFDGATGAWGWDEDGDDGTSLGRTEAATWVALDLKSPSRLTIRIERKPQAIDIRALFPGDTAGSNLRPAFTLLKGWDSDGGDEATFSNRGNVAWAEDTDYLDHVESSTEVAEGTFELDAGLYTVVLGGNSTSLIPEERQGYGARLTSVSLERAPVLTYKGGKNQVTSRPALKLSGRAGAPGDITTLRIFHHGKTRVVGVNGSSWSAIIKGLEFGKNTIWITPVSKYGTVFPAQRVKFTRK
jgi:hypothetical protein